jgi:hypothetical protein
VADFPGNTKPLSKEYLVQPRHELSCSLSFLKLSPLDQHLRHSIEQVHVTSGLESARLRLRNSSDQKLLTKSERLPVTVSIRVPAPITDDRGNPELCWKPNPLYKLAEKLCLPQLQDQVVDMFKEADRQNDSFSSIIAILNAYFETRI